MRTILLALDSLEHSRRALEAATEIAESMKAKAHVAVAIAPERAQVTDDPVTATQEDPGEDPVDGDIETLNGVVEALRLRGITATGQLISGPLCERLAEVAKLVEADLLVVGGDRDSRLVNAVRIGVSAELLEDSPCPLYLVPPALEGSRAASV